MITFIEFISSISIGYLFGCFQTSFFISKIILKKDIRELGSGNAGASNVTSELGWKFGIITGILDILKAFSPAILIIYIFPNSLFHNDLSVIAGSCAVLGHIYPFFLGFKGGKGVASYIGLLFALSWQFGVAAIFGLIILTIITDHVFIGSILLYLIIPFFVFFFSDYSFIVLLCTLILCLIGILKHWVNIIRYIHGEETGLRSVYNKNKSK